MTHIYGLEGPELKFAERAAAIAKDVAAPASADVDAKGRFPKEAIDALASQGFFGLCLPASHGGQGQGTRVFAAVVEELAQACGSTAMVYVMHVSAAQTIAASASLAERDALLREIAGGKHLTTLAWSEKGSRSQFWLPMSRLEPDGDGFKTSARKSWVTAAGNADSFVSSAQIPGAKSPMESVVYLLRRKTSGVRIPSAFDGLGLRGNDSAPVELEAVRLRKGA
jgi:alkylation response protein AidB-like acyl-CoA dehydrogenase